MPQGTLWFADERTYEPIYPVRLNLESLSRTTLGRYADTQAAAAAEYRPDPANAAPVTRVFLRFMAGLCNWLRQSAQRWAGSSFVQ